MVLIWISIILMDFFFALFPYKFHQNNFVSKPTKKLKCQLGNTRKSMGIWNFGEILWPLTTVVYKKKKKKEKKYHQGRNAKPVTK